MTSPSAPSDDHATPLTPEEEAQLVPSFIKTRDELNRAEQQAIADAARLVLRRPPNAERLLDSTYLLRLHRSMFKPVWKWAGKIRTTERNIGVEPWRIRTDLQQLLDDARAWVEHTSYPPDEIAVRFHHRLVAIHCFANGNGRHARLVADLLALALGQAAFTWGAGDLAPVGEVRSAYLAALKQADQHDYAALLWFARS
jgi:Fic-DOC domain mobile mystery protein B